MSHSVIYREPGAVEKSIQEASQIDQISTGFSDAREEWYSTADQTATLLIVDPEGSELQMLDDLLSEEGWWTSLRARSCAEALFLLDNQHVDLVLLALSLPPASGLECFRRIRSNRGTRSIPVLMMAPAEDSEIAAAGFRSRADEFMEKPYRPETLKGRVSSLLRQHSVRERLEESEAVLLALAQAVEQRDPATAAHCERMALYSVALGMQLGLPRRDLMALHHGGFLHDVGKISIPDSILFKAGPLSSEEWTLMRAHTLRGEEICRPLKSLAPVLPIIRGHHERWDGTGYPDKLRGDQIPLLARVLQTADIYDALTSVRPYKPAMSPASALVVIQQETELGWRDPKIVAAFLKLPHQALRETADQNAFAHLSADAMRLDLHNLCSAI
jgi:cyclic di-GMP phosphodiesterase